MPCVSRRTALRVARPGQTAGDTSEAPRRGASSSPAPRDAPDCVRRPGRIALRRGEAAAGRNPRISFHLTSGSRSMPATRNILIMGASYGSLLASKLLFGGHRIHLVCLPAEADLINAEGFEVRLPVRGRKAPVVLRSRN